MPASRGAFDSAYEAAKQGLTRWLGSAREAVMAPWRRFRAAPNPEAIYATVPAWQADVDRILAALTPALREGWAAAHLPGDYDPQDPYIQANLALTRNLLVRIPDEVHAMVVAAILEGSNNAESTEQIARRVDDILTFTGSENWNHRAQVIAQTETNRHFNGSMLAHGLLREKAGEAGLSKRWDTVMDGKERKAHELANDDVQPLGQPFIVDGEALLFPGDPTGSPSNVINCVPGSTIITAHKVIAAYRFLWTGSLITVIGERGLRFTVSPNHPVLTELGWVAACDLQKGDSFIGTSFGDAPTRTSPDVQSGPTEAEEIFKTLVGVAHRQRVNGLSVNFYGDRPDGDVDVVLAHRPLSFGLKAADLDHFSQFCFTCADAPASPLSSLHQFTIGSRNATNCSMRFGDLVSPLLNRHQVPLHGFGLGLASKRNAIHLQPATDCLPTDAKVLGESINGPSHQVFLDKVIDVTVNTISTTHLYTFQTNSGIYLANGIVSHNCRCSLRLEKAGR